MNEIYSDHQQFTDNANNSSFAELSSEFICDLEKGNDGIGNKLRNTSKPFKAFKIAVTPQDLGHLAKL